MGKAATTLRKKKTWQWKMDPLKMYVLLKMVIFHCYVSSPEGKHELNKKGRSTANSASLSLGIYLGVGRSMPGVASRFAQTSWSFIQGFLEKWHLTKL